MTILEKLVHVALQAPHNDTQVTCGSKTAFAHGTRCLAIVDNASKHISLYKGYNETATMCSRIYSFINENHVSINSLVLKQGARNGYVLDVFGCKWTVQVSKHILDLCDTTYDVCQLDSNVW